MIEREIELFGNPQIAALALAETQCEPCASPEEVVVHAGATFSSVSLADPLTSPPRSESEPPSASWEVKASTSGWTVQWQGATISWGSRKQACAALSSVEAEIMALSEGAKDMVYFRKLVRGIDDKASSAPNPLGTDNEGARDLSYNPEHHDRTKHIQRRHFWIRETVEDMELCVPLVSTHDNYADFLTKPLAPKLFFALRALIMNEPCAYNYSGRPQQGGPGDT